MVNTLLDRTFRDKKMMIEGGEQLRPCLHVDDLCNAYIQSIENPISNGKIYNVTNENIYAFKSTRLGLKLKIYWDKVKRFIF